MRAGIRSIELGRQAKLERALWIVAAIAALLFWLPYPEEPVAARAALSTQARNEAAPPAPAIAVQLARSNSTTPEEVFTPIQAINIKRSKP